MSIKRTLHTGIFFLLLCILLPGNPLEAQQVSRQLLPEQQETLDKLKRQLGGMRNFDCPDSSRTELPKTIAESLDEMDPVLVGKNIVFSKAWLNHIGSRKEMSRSQFTGFVRKMDRVYEVFAELTGNTAVSGRVIYIDLVDLQGTAAAHAHVSRDVICMSHPRPWFWREMTRYNSWSYMMMHEIAHMFAPPAIGWRACPESMANLKVAYALEKLGAQFGSPEYRQGHGNLQPTRGSQYRMREFNKALENSKKEQINPFADCCCGGSIFDYYLFGLVEEVGWEPYKKAFHSYLDPDFVPAYTYRGVRSHTRAIDFLDRLVHFSGSPDLLTNGPDKGSLLEVYEVTKVPRRQTTAGQTAAGQRAPAPLRRVRPAQ